MALARIVSTTGGTARRVAGQAISTGVALALIAVGSAPLAIAWFAASRLAYVLFVGVSLQAEVSRKALSRTVGSEEAWRRFSDRAHWVMFNDAVALGALCIVTRDTLDWPLPQWAAIAAGAVLVVLGVGTKMWASASLERGSFYWRNFFVPPAAGLSASGPYRWLSNPMYTIGYAHAYGFALALGSVHGLIASALAQAAILVMNHLVEDPHTNTLDGA